MSAVYFFKAIWSSVYCLGPQSRAVYFDPIEKNRGILSLDSDGPDLPGQPIPNQAQLIQALNHAASIVKGGVKRISEQEYQDLKKNHPWKQPEPKSWLDEPLKINGRKPKAPLPAGKQAIVPPVKRPEPEADQGPPEQPDFRTNPEMFKPNTRRFGEVKAGGDI